MATSAAGVVAAGHDAVPDPDPDPVPAHRHPTIVDQPGLDPPVPHGPVELGGVVVGGHRDRQPLLVLLGRDLVGQRRHRLGPAVMDHHRPPLYQRRGYQVGIAAVSQQQGQIGVVDVGACDRQAGGVDGDDQEPVDPLQYDRPLGGPAGRGFHDPTPPDRPQLAGIAHQPDRRPGLGGHVDEGVGLVHGHQPGLVHHYHRPPRQHRRWPGPPIDPAGARVFLAYRQPRPPAHLAPAEPVLIHQLRQRRRRHPHLAAGHQRRLAGGGHHHHLPALDVQPLPGRRQHPGLAGPGRADHHLQA